MYVYVIKQPGVLCQNNSLTVQLFHSMTSNKTDYAIRFHQSAFCLHLSWNRNDLCLHKWVNSTYSLVCSHMHASQSPCLLCTRDVCGECELTRVHQLLICALTGRQSAVKWSDNFTQHNQYNILCVLLSTVDKVTACAHTNTVLGQEGASHNFTQPIREYLITSHCPSGSIS